MGLCDLYPTFQGKVSVQHFEQWLFWKPGFRLPVCVFLSEKSFPLRSLIFSLGEGAGSVIAIWPVYLPFPRLPLGNPKISTVHWLANIWEEWSWAQLSNIILVNEVFFSSDLIWARMAWPKWWKSASLLPNSVWQPWAPLASIFVI